MDNKSTYERAQIDLLEFECSDIVTASNLETEGEDSTGSGWTPSGWQFLFNFLKNTKGKKQ